MNESELILTDAQPQSWLKKRLPKSLFGRALLIILLPVIIMQIIVAFIFFDAHWETVTARMTDSVAAEVAVATMLYEQAPGSERAERLDQMLRPNMQLSVVLKAGKDLPNSTRRAFFSALDSTLRKALARNLKNEFWFDTTRYPNYIDIRVAVDEGYLLYIVPRDRVFAPTGYIFLFWLIMATSLLTLVSILFIRNQARPIVQLAKAAEQFGKGQSIGPFKPSGAREVRQAGHSFLEMRSRIARHISQRTELLAGVSHDLRTPLTRLKLYFAMQNQDKDVASARRDLDDMAEMLDGYLDFARGQIDEEISAAQLSQLIDECIEPHHNEQIAVNLIDDPVVNVHAGSIKRALTNIIENALHYGNRADICLQSVDGFAEIVIDDSGPGIAPADRGEVFKPFVRLDSARNQNVKGVGLGLAIALDSVQSHGGTIILDDAPSGGLRCTVRLPQ